MNNRWFIIVLIGLGLIFYGYKVYNERGMHTSRINRGPVAVAAVRGGNQISEHALSSAGNVAVDYTTALKDDVSMAQKNVEKYNNSVKSQEDSYKKAGSALGD